MLKEAISADWWDSVHIMNYYNCISSLQNPQKDDILQCFDVTQSSTQNHPCESLLEECQMYLPAFAAKSSEKDKQIVHSLQLHKLH